jgi:hypothetical protein
MPPTNYSDVAALALGLVLPAIVALLTKKSTNSTVKGIAHMVLAVGTGFGAVYQSDPKHLYWVPAVVASFLAWLTGTAFYHSLLKKYRWFGWLQDTLVRDAESLLHVDPEVLVDYNALTQGEDTSPVNDFPLSTDLLQGAAEEVAQIPVVAQAVQTVEAVAAPVVTALFPQVSDPTAVLPAQPGI